MPKLTVRPILTGYCSSDKKNYLYHHSVHAYRQVDDKKMFVPSLTFLVEGGKELVLVDTGMADTERAGKYHHPGSYQPEGFAIHERLAALGIKPGDIGLVVFTHMHWDHIYNMEKFVNARFVAHRDEYECAIHPIPLYYKSYEHPALGIRRPFEGMKIDVVDGEEDVAPGIRVFPSPGHSPGHQSVEIETVDGKYICCGDSVFIYANLEPCPEMHYTITPPGRFADIIKTWKSIEALKARAERRELILPTHEPEIEKRMAQTPVFGA